MYVHKQNMCSCACMHCLRRGYFICSTVLLDWVVIVELVSVIVKWGDDLRQELLCSQLLEQFKVISTIRTYSTCTWSILTVLHGQSNLHSCLAYCWQCVCSHNHDNLVPRLPNLVSMQHWKMGIGTWEWGYIVCACGVHVSRMCGILSFFPPYMYM